MSKFSDFPDGRGKFGKFGSGYNIQRLPPGVQIGVVPITFNDFRGGFNAASPRDNVAANTSQNANDIELTPAGSLKVMPGTTPIQSLTHAASQFAVHVSLSGSSELVIFAPPYIGIYRNSAVQWTDIGLSAKRPVVHASFGDQLFFYGGGGEVFSRP